MHPADLPDTVSVFPLPGALLLPRSRLPLHIFEPRYLQMLDDALKTKERLIGMVQPNPCQNDDTKLHRIGCAGRVTQFSETEDGRYLITLSGVSRFRIQSELDGFTPYRRCAVTWDGFNRDLGKIVCYPCHASSFVACVQSHHSCRSLLLCVCLGIGFGELVALLFLLLFFACCFAVLLVLLPSLGLFTLVLVVA